MFDKLSSVKEKHQSRMKLPCLTFFFALVLEVLHFIFTGLDVNWFCMYTLEVILQIESEPKAGWLSCRLSLNQRSGCFFAMNHLHGF